MEDKNFEQKALFERLKSQGEKLIFYIPAWAMTMPDGETTADTIHLTDLGMQRYVDLVLPVIREALRLSGQVPAPEQAIGVFDSGTGGLTVLEKLLELDAFDNGTGAERADGVPDLGREKFQYLADQANMPYGTYDAAGKADYLRQLVVADADFLMGDRYSRDAAEKEPSGWKGRCKILVIGCNTATAYGLDLVRKKLDEAGDGVKVIGVIEAGSKAALKALADEEQPFAIGVLATQGTISSGAYERTLKALALPGTAHRHRRRRHQGVPAPGLSFRDEEACPAGLQGRHPAERRRQLRPLQPGLARGAAPPEWQHGSAQGDYPGLHALSFPSGDDAEGGPGAPGLSGGRTLSLPGPPGGGPCLHRPGP